MVNIAGNCCRGKRCSCGMLSIVYIFREFNFADVCARIIAPYGNAMHSLLADLIFVVRHQTRT